MSVYEKKDRLKRLVLSVMCSVLPDADTIGLRLGVPYESFFGHRGFFHSLPFAGIVALIVIVLFFRKDTISWVRKLYLWGYFFLITSLHPILDAMTTGGGGVALFSPFDTTRYFLPYTPIVVSPISIRHFFSEWGLSVLKSEFIWIWIPAIAIVCLNIMFKFFLTSLRKNRQSP
ncbi:MAG: metal-dependent hydrolase [Calditrichia bacterium]